MAKEKAKPKVGTQHLHVKSGDTVVVITGKDKGHTGKINRAYPRDGRVIVEGAAIVKRHQKPRGQGMPGGIIDKESPIHASNVMLICPSCKKATRIAHKIVVHPESDKSTKVRVCKKCNAAIDS